MDSPARSPQRERQPSPQRERLPGQTRTAQLVDAIRHLAKVQKYANWDTRYKEDSRRIVERALLEAKGETNVEVMATKIRVGLRVAAEEYRARAAAEKTQDVSHIDGVVSRTASLAESREADVAVKLKAAEDRRVALDAQLVGLRRAVDSQTGRTTALEEKRKALRTLRAKNMLRQECLDRLDWSAALNEPAPRPLFASSGSSNALSTSPPKAGVLTLSRTASPSPDVLLATLRRAAAQPARPASSSSQSSAGTESKPSSISPRPSTDGSEPPRSVSPSPASTMHRPVSPARSASPQRAPSPLPSRTSQTSQSGTIQRPVSPSPTSTMMRSPRSASPAKSLVRSPSPQPTASGSTEEARLLYVQRGAASPGGPSLRGINAQWQPDAEAPQCRSCRARFTFTLRRHHCRLCGYIFCADCSARRVRIPSMLLGPGAIKGEALQEQRVCNKCYNAIMLQEPPT